MFLKSLGSLSVNGLLAKLWVYKTNVCSSNPPRVANCNSTYNKAL